MNVTPFLAWCETCDVLVAPVSVEGIDPQAIRCAAGHEVTVVSGQPQEQGQEHQ